MDAKDEAQAEIHFRNAIVLKPDFRSALFNLALMLTSSAEAKAGGGGGGGGSSTESKTSTKDLFQTAVDAAENLLRHHPNHVKGLILMGDLQINRMKNLSYAERCFSRAFELDPKNDQALHNLCVVFVERDQLDEAKNCLEKVLKMTPHVAYVRRHLQIVLSRIESRKRNTEAGARG